MSEIRDELDPPFEVLEPKSWRGPVLFNSPHSGSIYPRDFLANCRLDIATLRRSEDSFVDELIAGVVQTGFPMMRAHFPRCFVDVNREPYELDPRMFDGRLPSFANTRSMRVAGAWERWRAWSEMRRKSMTSASRSMMPCSALRASTSLIIVPCGGSLPVCIGNSAPPCWSIAIRCRRRPAIGMRGRDRSSYSEIATAQAASAWWRRPSRKLCGRLGYTVSRNKPYAGGFITEHYGNPAVGLHAIQLEINRALYMDERQYQRSPTFNRLAEDMETLARRLGEIPLEQLRPYRAAAE